MLQQLQHYLNRLQAKPARGCWRRESATEWGSLNKATFKSQHGLAPKGCIRCGFLSWPNCADQKQNDFNSALCLQLCMCVRVCVSFVPVYGLCPISHWPDRTQSKSCGRFAHINIFRAKARFVFAETRVNCFHLLQSQSQNVNENENETKNAARLLNS